MLAITVFFYSSHSFHSHLSYCCNFQLMYIVGFNYLSIANAGQKYSTSLSHGAPKKFVFYRYDSLSALTPNQGEFAGFPITHHLFWCLIVKATNTPTWSQSTSTIIMTNIKLVFIRLKMLTRMQIRLSINLWGWHHENLIAVETLLILSTTNFKETVYIRRNYSLQSFHTLLLINAIFIVMRPAMKNIII